MKTTKQATATGKLDITFLSDLNEKKIAQLKKEGKKTALRVTIQGKEDENKAVKAAELGVDYVIINCLDWRVIPLENLIAKRRGKSKLIAEVTNAEDAKLVLETLELGTDGVLLKTANPDELVKTVKIVKAQTLENGVNISANYYLIKPISTGARVCVDTCRLDESRRRHAGWKPKRRVLSWLKLKLTRTPMCSPDLSE